MSFNFYDTKFSQSENIDVDREYNANEIENKKYVKGSVVAIFDLDTICYPVSAVCDKTSIDVTKIGSSGKTRNFKNRTEFKKLCKVKGLDISDFVINDVVVPEPIENCLYSIRSSIDKLMKEVGATHAEYYVGGSGNFRLSLPLPIQYKGNRSGMRKPTHLKEAVNYTIKKYKAKKISGIECDDMVNIRAIEINKQEGVKGVLVSTDKDIFATFASPIYTYRQGELKYISETLGELHFKSNGGLIGTGLKWQLTQALITGDSTDNYIPRHFFKKRYGEKVWYKDVKEIDNVKDFLIFATNKFRELVGDIVEFVDWEGKQQRMTYLELADLYFLSAYMKTSSNDKRTYQSLLEEFEVDI